VDGTFGSRGVARVDMGANDFLNGVALASNGSFYGAGTKDINGTSDFAAAQFTANGVLGTGWTGGKAFANWGSSSSAWAVHVRDDGQVVVAGCSGSGIDWLQYGPGSSTAVTGGTVDFPGTNDCALAVRFVGTSQLLVAGYVNLNGDQNIVLARFLTVPSAVSAAGDAPPTPPGLGLRAPFPNPVTQRCSITFDLPRSGLVQVSLHDVTGRLVRTLANGVLAAGPHHFDWDRTDDDRRRVAAGVYYLRIDGGNERARATVVVVN
jgi:hypothetical protein